MNEHVAKAVEGLAYAVNRPDRNRKAVDFDEQTKVNDLLGAMMVVAAAGFEIAAALRALRDEPPVVPVEIVKTEGES